MSHLRGSIAARRITPQRNEQEDPRKAADLGRILAAYERQLEEGRSGSKEFKECGALELAMPLLRAIADPDDVVSLVGFLRGPLCGVDDDALYRFVRSGGAFSPFREPPAGADERVARGLEIVREAIDDAGKHPPAAALGRLFDRVGLTALAATGERGGTQSGNLLLALTIARDDSANGNRCPQSSITSKRF